jgi:hypothetical protein
MIIIWRGNGIIALLIFLLCCVGFIVGGTMLADVELLARVMPRWLAERFAPAFGLGGLSAGPFTAGLICYWLDRSWRQDGSRHELWFIPVRYWSIIGMILGLCPIALLIVAIIVGLFR